MPPSQAQRREGNSQDNFSQSLNKYEGGSEKPSGASEADTVWKDDPPQQPGDAYKTPKRRIYYADWTRALAIQLVIFVHCLVNSADASGFDPELNPAAQQKKDGIIKSLVQIGIPMFFYISGMAATFFNTEGKGFGIYFTDKVLRLAVPFVVGIFVFLVPRLYFGQQYEDWCRPDGKIEEDYWTFQAKTLPTIFSKLSWLWYLPALFIDCMLTYPLLAWSVRRAKKIPFNARDDGNIILMQLAIFVIWCFPCFYLDTSNNYGVRYLLPSTITLVCIFAIFYTFQMAIYSGENGHKYAMLMKIIGPLGSIALNYWKDQAPNQPLHHVLMMINYDAVFFSQGMLDQLYFKQMLRSREQLGKTAWAPITVLFAILLYALSSPQNYQQTGFLFFYPLYSDYTIQCLYTTGTWMWVFFITWVMHYVANRRFNETIYYYMAGSSLFAYLSHYFFIIVIAVMIIRPYKITFIPALVIEYFLTNTVVLVSFIIFDFLWKLVFPGKTKEQKDKEKEEEQQALLKQEITLDAKKAN